MAYKFNPLIKECLQLDNGGGGDTQQKVTKCTTADELDAVADDEIFEWQGVETIINGTTLENGYFYKKAAGSTYTIPSGAVYFDVLSDIVTDLFTIPAGRYYQLEQVQGVYAYGIAYKTINDVKCTWLTNYNDTIDHVGNYVCFQNGDVTTITELSDGYAHDDSAGNNLYSAGRNNFGQKNIFTFVSDNGDFADFCMVFGDNSNNTYITGKVINGNYCPWNNSYFVGTYFNGGKLDEDYTVDSTTYTRINTQPPTPGITEENGTLKISFPVQFEDDVTVKGTQTVVHTEEIESENDYIELRADNPLGLANGERSGLEVNNYDGNGTDCILAVDNQGWARVGDKNGTLQKLATIEENPTDAQFVQYDAQNKQLKTAVIPEATNTAAGLMSRSDKRAVDPIIINEGSILSVLKNIGNQINKTYTLNVYGNVSDKPYNISYITVQISNVLGYQVVLFAQSYEDLHCKIGIASINPNSASPITWSNDIV